MDQDLEMLLALPSTSSPGVEGDLETEIRQEGLDSPNIEVDTPAGPRSYTLKPLKDLYGSGTGAPSINPRDEQFLPLLLSIEEAIFIYHQDVDPALTDGSVLLVVKQLGIDPDAEQSDPLGRRINIALRLNLSLNDYSRQDVRGCLRQVAKSVERHTRAEGPRGYLKFIGAFFGGKRRR